MTHIPLLKALGGFVTMLVIASLIVFHQLAFTEAGYAIGHEFPYVVSIRTYQNNTHFCVGSVIHKRWILTAASCFSNHTKPEDVIVYAGTQKSEGTRGTSSIVQKIIVHPKYDIAVLKLKHRLYFFRFFTFKVLPIKAVTGEVEEDLVTVGWGTLSDGREIKTEPSLNFLEVATTGSEDGGCQSTRQSICVVSKERKDAICWGDIGEPLVYRGEEEDYLVGVSSHFDDCSSGKAQVFTRVESYAFWIKDKTGVDINLH